MNRQILLVARSLEISWARGTSYTEVKVEEALVYAVRNDQFCVEDGVDALKESDELDSWDEKAWLFIGIVRVV